MIIRYKQDVLISIDFQSEEVKSMYIDHSRISEWFRLLSSFSLSFSIPLHERVLHLIYPPLNNLYPPLVDHPKLYLSTCPIRHPLQLSVSCGSQYNTVQRSSPQKCDLKSSSNTFNVVVTTFSQIFLGFLPSHVSAKYIYVIEASWKVTLIAGLYILNPIH